MSLLKKASEMRKKKNCVESKPVISRSGKIARVREDIQAPKKTGSESDAAQSGRSVTISDEAFSFEQLRREAVRDRKRVHTVKEKQRKPFPVMAVVFSLICTILFMTVIINFVQVNEYSKDISSLQNRIQKIDKESAELQAALEEKNNAERLRTYLKDHAEEMGMVEEDQMRAPVAITPEKEEEINDYEAKDEDENIVSVVLSALAGNLINAWNIFTGNE